MHKMYFADAAACKGIMERSISVTMMQRPQSIFLLTMIVSLLIATLVPIWSKEERKTPYAEVEKAYYMNAWSLQAFSNENPIRTYRYPYSLVGWISLLSIGIAIYELFRYNSRVVQIKLGALNTLVMAMLVGFTLYLTIQQEKHWPSEVLGKHQLGSLCLGLAFVSNVIATPCIKKDEKRVRDADRIR